MSEPIVSVLMPVYNAARYLPEALNSILAQTFSDFEVVAVDDGSTDDSGRVLRDAAERDARVRVISQANGGIVVALNRGLEQVRGTYVARMDADDVASPSRLAAQAAYLGEHSDCVAVGSQVVLVDPDGDEIGPKPNLRVSHDEIDSALLAGEWPIVHPSVMVRVSALRALGGYRDYRTWEDHDLFLRLAETGRLANIAEPLLKYRLHFGSIVHQRGSTKSDVLNAVLRDAAKRRGLSVPPVAYEAPTPTQTRLNWVWWALAAGQATTARKHAWRAMRERPLSGASWRAMACATRGH